MGATLPGFADAPLRHLRPSELIGLRSKDRQSKGIATEVFPDQVSSRRSWRPLCGSLLRLLDEAMPERMKTKIILCCYIIF
jgi:hypothetical protein